MKPRFPLSFFAILCLLTTLLATPLQASPAMDDLVRQTRDLEPGLLEVLDRMAHVFSAIAAMGNGSGNGSDVTFHALRLNDSLGTFPTRIAAVRTLGASLLPIDTPQGLAFDRKITRLGAEFRDLGKAYQAMLKCMTSAPTRDVYFRAIRACKARVAELLTLVKPLGNPAPDLARDVFSPPPVTNPPTNLSTN